jgi:hypothetical protein
MLEALFGADMPLAVRFFLAFLIVLGLIVPGRFAGSVPVGWAARAHAGVSPDSPSSTTLASTRAGGSFSSAATTSSTWC